MSDDLLNTFLSMSDDDLKGNLRLWNLLSVYSNWSLEEISNYIRRNAAQRNEMVMARAAE